MNFEQENGYTIIQSVCFDDGGGFAIGYDEKAVFPLVTWQFTQREDGGKSYFCGYYYTLGDAEYAKLDYDKRVKKYETENSGITVKTITTTPLQGIF